MVGASDENLDDVKNLSEHGSEWSKFLHEIDYDFDKWKEWATATHKFLASKMGG